MNFELEVIGWLLQENSMWLIWIYGMWGLANEHQVKLEIEVQKHAESINAAKWPLFWYLVWNSIRTKRNEIKCRKSMKKEWKKYKTSVLAMYCAGGRCWCCMHFRNWIYRSHITDALCVLWLFWQSAQPTSHLHFHTMQKIVKAIGWEQRQRQQQRQQQQQSEESYQCEM